MNARYDGGASDAQLASGAAAGDQQALAVIFDRYAPRLLAFCHGMLPARADAEDCLQNVFVIAATRLGGLREPERLRSWLYAVARHECLARIDRARREAPVDSVPDVPAGEADQPGVRAQDRELAELMRAALAGLPERDRVALELADRDGLATDEVADVLGMAPPSAYKVISRARGLARRSLGAVVVARTGRAHCADLDLLLTGWDGSLTPLLRKRIARHIEECETCGERERRLVSPAALLGSAPALAIPAGLRSSTLDAARRAVHGPPASAGNGPSAPSAGPSGPSSGPSGPSSGPSGPSGPSGLSGPSAPVEAARGWRRGWPPGSGRARRLLPVVAAAVVVVLLGAGGVALAVRPHSDVVAGAPATAGGTVSGPAPSTAASSPSSSTASSSTAASRPHRRHRSTSASASAASRSAAGAPTSPASAPSRTRSRPPAGPTIDSMTVRCETSADGSRAPVLTWSTSRADGVALSVDNPGIVGSYGTYGPSGTLELPPNGCTPGAGTQTYTLTTTGGAGRADSRTITLDPPDASSAPSSPASSSAGTTSGAPPGGGVP